MRAQIAAALLVLIGTLAACLPSGTPGSLAPTLGIEDMDGLEVATQNGIPVPGFGWQPRPRIELDGAWHVERAALDERLTMGDRADGATALEAEADGRQGVAYDHGAWERLEVPGTTNPPPDGEEGGAWYRRSFEVPASWAGSAATLKFASANYVADVWLNGTWMGYHEGGSTPFAFDVGAKLIVGGENLLAVRVHTLPLGTRSDVLPWGVIDWWNYGGLTGSVWLEASAPIHVARADVTPYLDAVDVEVLVARAAHLAGREVPAAPANGDRPVGTVRASLLPASVTDENLLDPDPRALLPPATDAIVTAEAEIALPEPGRASGVTLSIAFGDADLWSPARPSLYVLRIDVSRHESPLDPREAGQADTFWTTFGIRHVAVDPIRPRVLLNGEAAFFRGVGVHGESLEHAANGRLVAGTPVQTAEDVHRDLIDAGAIGANLIRSGHLPASPTLLMLADRLGFAVWEEIPIYHATPFIFDRVMGRGIAQQMLREMALRDMNHPSVLFHGLANESTGDEERRNALAELHDVDRQIDGTRLTGQAAYGWNPSDPTHAPLDVAGFTFYHGVFYGDEPGPDTRRALRAANEANPAKPIMILEFGRWADLPADERRQELIFEETYAALQQRRADDPNGFVSGATWWTLRDFATQIADIEVEQFGLQRPDGSLRPAGEAAARSFHAPAGRGTELALEPDLDRPRAELVPEVGNWALLGYLGYGLAVVIAVLVGALLVLTRRGGRALGRGR